MSYFNHRKLNHPGGREKTLEEILATKVKRTYLNPKTNSLTDGTAQTFEEFMVQLARTYNLHKECLASDIAMGSNALAMGIHIGLIETEPCSHPSQYARSFDIKIRPGPRFNEVMKDRLEKRVRNELHSMEDQIADIQAQTTCIEALYQQLGRSDLSSGLEEVSGKLEKLISVNFDELDPTKNKSK